MTESLYDHRIAAVETVRRTAIKIEGLAVATSLAANLAAAPATVGGWAFAAVAPLGLFLAVVLWHRSTEILDGPAAHLFNVVLGIIAFGAAAVSYDHLRHVAIAFGQPVYAGYVLPVVVDGVALLAVTVVVAAGRKIERLQLEQVETTKPKPKPKQQVETTKPKPKQQVEITKPKQTKPDRILQAISVIDGADQMAPGQLLAAIGWEDDEGNRKALQRARTSAVAT